MSKFNISTFSTVTHDVFLLAEGPFDINARGWCKLEGVFKVAITLVLKLFDERSETEQFLLSDVICAMCELRS